MRSAEWQRGYNSGYQAGQRRTRRSRRPLVDRSRYSEGVHRRLLDVHARRWEEMHAHCLQHGRDATYRELRASMIEASRAVSRYVESTLRRRGER